MKFVHVATRTRDLEAAVKFYEQLGLHEKKRQSELTKGKATLVFMAPEADNFAIELVYNWGKDDGYPGGERFGHFAFETEDIDAVLPVLELFGGRVTRSRTCWRATARGSRSWTIRTATRSSSSSADAGRADAGEPRRSAEGRATTLVTARPSARSVGLRGAGGAGGARGPGLRRALLTARDRPAASPS